MGGRALTAHCDLLAVTGRDPVDVRQLGQVFPGLIQKIQDIASVELLLGGRKSGKGTTPVAPLLPVDAQPPQTPKGTQETVDHSAVFISTFLPVCEQSHLLSPV